MLIFPSPPAGYETSLLIEIDPPLPFLHMANKQRGKIFYFDQGGCLMR
ncbi:MAG: hypothetical protein ABJC87_07670 [Roseobacter sp.]